METPVAVMSGPNQLDEMIMGVQVQRVQRVRIKFLAIAGGCGPELNMPESIARSLYESLSEIFDGEREVSDGKVPRSGHGYTVRAIGC